MTGVGLAGDCFTSFAMTEGKFAMTGRVIARPEAVAISGDGFAVLAMTGVGLAGGCFTSFGMMGGNNGSEGWGIKKPRFVGGVFCR